MVEINFSRICNAFLLYYLSTISDSMILHFFAYSPNMSNNSLCSLRPKLYFYESLWDLRTFRDIAKLLGIVLESFDRSN
jgi:hypothetical protein